MDFGDVLPQVLPALELSGAVAALEVPLVGVNHHVILELVLVPQLLPADVAGVDGGVDVNRLDVVLERLVGAVRLAALALESLLIAVDVLVHQPVLVVEEGLAADGAEVRPHLSLVLVVALDVGQQILLEEELLVADRAAVLELRPRPVACPDAARPAHLLLLLLPVLLQGCGLKLLS